MKKLYVYIILFILFSCAEEMAIIECALFYYIHYENQSNYDITVHAYYTGVDEETSEEKLYIRPFLYSLDTVNIEEEHMEIFTQDILCPPPPITPIAHVDLHDVITSGTYDSIRLYFNEGKPDQRYITYYAGGFKPRDIRNYKEYRFEQVHTYHANFYYVFTNQDYVRAEKNDNATPIPIPEEELRCLYSL